MSPPDTPAKALTRKDFVSDQEVRWCPGCGDYAILAAMQKTLPELGVKRETTVFVSGIGCSSRFPYYMNTYGFHTIHGRAPAVATGIKLANPELDVWVVTGDGDGLSIGGNHLFHALRRNVGLKILMFNNRIYGLTKGQYSPTSLVGQRTPSTPHGSVDLPVLPAAFALGAGAHFVARSVDTSVKELGEVFHQAHEHRGAAFVEILQNCPVFNDGAFDHITEKAVAPEAQLWLEHGRPMLFGKDKQHGLRVKPGTLELEVVTLGEHGISERDVLAHDHHNKALAFLLANLEPPRFPTVFGLLYNEPAQPYEQAVLAQTLQAATNGPGDLNALLRQGHTWTVA